MDVLTECCFIKHVQVPSSGTVFAGPVGPICMRLVVNNINKNNIINNQQTSCPYIHIISMLSTCIVHSLHATLNVGDHSLQQDQDVIAKACTLQQGLTQKLAGQLLLYTIVMEEA